MSHADVNSDDPSDSEMDWREDWDHECSWRPWAVHPDPIGECKESFTDQHLILICCSLGSSGNPIRLLQDTWSWTLCGKTSLQQQLRMGKPPSLPQPHTGVCMCWTLRKHPHMVIDCSR